MMNRDFTAQENAEPESTKRSPAIELIKGIINQGATMKKNRSYSFITFTMRKAIEMMYNMNMGADEIAAKLEVSPSTIYRELKRGNTYQPDRNGRSGYSAIRAQRNADRRRSYRGKRRRITSPIDDESDNKHTFSNRDI